MSSKPPDTDSAPTRTLGQHIGCISIIAVLAIGLGLVAYEFVRINRMVTAYQDRFAQWTQVDASTIDQTEVVTTPTFFFAGNITLHGSACEIAMLGGDAELHGRYEGDVHFLGRYLDLAPDAEITGNLLIRGSRHVTLRGTVKGSVEGTWDRLFGDPHSQTETATPDAP